MNGIFKRTLLATCLGVAVGLAGTALAAGSWLQYDQLGQASSGGSATGSSSGATGTSGSSTGTGSATTPGTGSGTATGTSGTRSGPMGASTGSGSASPTSSIAQANAVFDQLDTNKDGVLSREEFSRATIRMQ